jgi:hypothetical protein
VFLQESVPIAHRGGVLEIRFPPGNRFHLQSVQKEKELVRQIIGQVVGRTFTLKFTHGEIPEDAAEPKETSAANAHPPANGLDPRVKKIIQLFDGELL